MFWYSELLKKEFVDYFSDEDSIYFTVTAKGKIYNDIYDRFKKTVDWLLCFANYDNDCCFEDTLYYMIDDKEDDIYKLAEAFFKREKRPDFKRIYHSIQDNVFNCDIESLSTDQLAVGLIFPFASRMGGSFEDDFAESGRLREFVLTLYNKSSALE